MFKVLIQGFLLRPKLGIAIGLLLVGLPFLMVDRLENEANHTLDDAYGIVQPGEPEPVDIPIPSVEAKKPANMARIGYADTLKFVANVGRFLRIVGGLMLLLSLGRLLRIIPEPVIEKPTEKPNEDVDGSNSRPPSEATALPDAGNRMHRDSPTVPNAQ